MGCSILDYKVRAIIGNIRNMSMDCVQGIRPRAQYLHFWRSTKKKMIEVDSELSGDTSDLRRATFYALKGVLDQYPNPTNKEAPEISEKCLQVLGLRSL